MLITPKSIPFAFWEQHPIKIYCSVQLYLSPNTTLQKQINVLQLWSYLGPQVVPRHDFECIPCDIRRLASAFRVSYIYIYKGYGEMFTSLLPLCESPSQHLSQLPPASHRHFLVFQSCLFALLANFLCYWFLLDLGSQNRSKID